ncbi:hypothetical protein C8Q76DRAFT_789807 [Earliella scabrosa]|nr:hypothetical protein C8Q76DRAFT_789807 [Earliella scabrosa]
MDGHHGFGSDHGASASSRATNVPIPPSASHVPEDPPTTLHGSARKRKKQNTANSATLGPRKRHCKSNGSQLHIATTTSSQDEPESAADSEYHPSTADTSDNENDAGDQAQPPLHPHLAIVNYPQDPAQLKPSFFQELCAVARDLLPPTAIARLERAPATRRARGSAGGSHSQHNKENIAHAPLLTNPQRLGQPRTTSKTPCPFSSCSGCTRSFTRAADLERHLIFLHLGLAVTCTSSAHGRRPAVLSRPDSVPRHMGKASADTCLGPRKYAALRRAVARRLGVPTDSKACTRAILREYARIALPCYQRAEVRRTLGMLRHKGDPGALEEWLGEFGTVVRCGCEPCQSGAPPREESDGGEGGDEPSPLSSPSHSNAGERACSVESDSAQRLPGEDEGSGEAVTDVTACLEEPKPNPPPGEDDKDDTDDSEAPAERGLNTTPGYLHPSAFIDNSHPDTDDASSSSPVAGDPPPAVEMNGETDGPRYAWTQVPDPVGEDLHDPSGVCVGLDDWDEPFDGRVDVMHDAGYEADIFPSQLDADTDAYYYGFHEPFLPFDT